MDEQRNIGQPRSGGSSFPVNGRLAIPNIAYQRVFFFASWILVEIFVIPETND
jgi:hypothetical protein